MTSSLSKLAQYTSCDASDALLKLKVRNGGFVLGPTMWSPRRQEGEAKAVGPAYTVTYALVADSRPKVDKHYIDGIPPGAVVFISGPEVPNCFYGGLMSTRAQASGAVGTVVIGRIRDLQEHRDLDFPVFARDVGTAPPHETVKVVAVNETIETKEGVVVASGDIVIADLNGVVVVPKDKLDQVVDLIPAQVHADEQMAEAIKAGMSFTDAGKKFRT